MPHPVVHYREPVVDIQLHAFGDASTQSVSDAVYAVTRQPSRTTQRLVAAKGWLAKQSLTIPRLELVSANMATNLVINLRNTLHDLPNSEDYAWLDSTFTLHWILGNGQRMRTQQIQRAGVEELRNCCGMDLTGCLTREIGPQT